MQAFGTGASQRLHGSCGCIKRHEATHHLNADFERSCKITLGFMIPFLEGPCDYASAECIKVAQALRKESGVLC